MKKKPLKSLRTEAALLVIARQLEELRDEKMRSILREGGLQPSALKALKDELKANRLALVKAEDWRTRVQKRAEGLCVWREDPGELATFVRDVARGDA